MASMPSDPALPPLVKVVFTAEFKRNVRQLAKKYRQIKTDVQPLLDELAQGATPGDQIPGVRYTVFKIRVNNSASRKGKRGGYRIIYQRVHEHVVVLVTIYSKTEQADIAPREIRQIILDYEGQSADKTTPAEPPKLSSDTTIKGSDTSP
jgi:mRNA-degrading endonuclease RelE of RelBE toxin-antitoxin system